MLRKSKIAKITVSLVVTVFIASLLVYCDEWPPISVVESQSMTHSDYWTAGTINVGDMVFVKKESSVPGNVVTYVQGRDSGFRSYGNYGNVILYKSSSGDTVIHRAMFYLTWNGATPEIKGYTNQAWIKVIGDYIIIDGAGYNGKNLIVNVQPFIGENGLITCGDYNLATGQTTAPWNASFSADQNSGITKAPISSKNIIGIAFWDVPWFGLIKLNILKLYGQWPESNQVAKNSYDYLAGVLILIFVVGFFPYGRFSSSNKNKKKGK